MHYAEAVALLNESGLSPERIAERLSVSNSTYRRWAKASPREMLPEAYHTNISSGVYKLLGEGLLSHDSPRVSAYLRKNVPEFFQAAIAGLHVSTDSFADNSSHQDKITAVLSQLGNNGAIRGQVDKANPAIHKFTGWGEAWKYRITTLLNVIKDAHLTLVDKLVAYGALFYLIQPFDLIPDSIPVFGYVDDFGILGFAAAYYAKKLALPDNTSPAAPSL
jgi:uncharacterized membrane protein YkvA (DUF1232 family)